MDKKLFAVTIHHADVIDSKLAPTLQLWCDEANVELHLVDIVETEHVDACGCEACKGIER